MRRIAVLLGRWAVHPATLGAAVMLVFVAVAARRGAEADEGLAGQSRAISAAVHMHFGDELVRMRAAIVGVAIAIGTGLGLLAAALLTARRRLLALWPSTWWRDALEGLGLVLLLHLAFEAYAMAATPQLFADAFYTRGGLLRTTEVVMTDVVGRSGVLLLALAALLLFMAGPPSLWRAWPSRLRELGTSARSVARRAPVPVAALVSLSCLAAALGAAPAAPGRPAVVKVASAAGPEARVTHPNILILAADSLRADRITPRIAPRLSRLAEQGVAFDHAYVSLPRTFPSWVTLLTGRHPHHHGIRSMFPRWEDRAKDFDALPERLAREGYHAAVVSDFAGDIFDRIGLGWSETRVPTFDFRQLIRQRALERQTPLLPYLQSRAGRAVFPVLRELNDAADPELLTRDAIATIHESAATGHPFFVTVFYSTAHFPYAAPAPYYERFTNAAYRGRYKYDKPVGLEHDAPADATDIAQVRGLYDGAVAGIDDGVGQILDDLARTGLAEQTVVVVVADHGETLDDNGHGEGHGDHLFGDEGTHVPLIIYDPRHADLHRHVAGVVRDVDLAPTIYELSGVAPSAAMDGESLGPALSGKELPSRLAYAETGLWFTEDVRGLAPSLRLPYPGVAGVTEVDADHNDEVVLSREQRPLAIVAKHRMVRDDRYKLLYVPTRTGVSYLLYDTVSDPGETRDVAPQHAPEVARLQGELWRWMLSDPDMVERGGYLVPRDGGVVVAPKGADAHIIRVDGVGDAADDASHAPEHPGPEP